MYLLTDGLGNIFRRTINDWKFIDDIISGDGEIINIDKVFNVEITIDEKVTFHKSTTVNKSKKYNLQKKLEFFTCKCI
jgi:hypothetical protein